MSRLHWMPPALMPRDCHPPHPCVRVCVCVCVCVCVPSGQARFAATEEEVTATAPDPLALRRMQAECQIAEVRAIGYTLGGCHRTRLQLNRMLSLWMSLWMSPLDEAS